jgi:anti-sigma factor RsiW
MDGLVREEDMHPVIIENLEEYMAGTLLPGVHREFEAHLESCLTCREEVRGMQEMSALFTTLRPEEAISPPLGFAARVMEGTVRRQKPSVWGWLSLDPRFGRRVVFASLLTLAVLGSYLVSRETGYTAGPASPVAVMAIEQRPAQQSPHSDRDMMLVTLTTYEP